MFVANHAQRAPKNGRPNAGDKTENGKALRDIRLVGLGRGLPTLNTDSIQITRADGAAARAMDVFLPHVPE